jgi:YidC/Oxa1 family membrane protein insertase
LAEFHNPNHQAPGAGGSGGGGGDMRVVMGFTVVMLVALLAFDYFKPKPAVPESQPQQTQSQQAAAPLLPTGSVQSAATAPVTNAGSVAAAPQVSATVETETTIENSQYKIVFSNRGALVKHWILKHYNGSDMKPLDLVQQQASARFGLPMALFTYEPALTQQVNQALYQVTTTGAPITITGHAQVPATSALSFHYQANGLDVVKTFRFDDSYVLGIETQVLRNGSPVRALVSWPAGLGDMEEFLPSSLTRSQTRTASQFDWSLEGKQDYIRAPKLSGNDTHYDPYQYAAVSDLYFTAAFLPDQPSSATTVTFHNSIDLTTNLSDPNSPKRVAEVIGLAMGDQSGVTRLRFYAGPKDADVLKTIHAIGPDGKATGQTLEPLIQYGWLTILAKPLYWALRYLHTHMGAGPNSWGWAIIIVTMIINLAMLPTRFSMMKSSLGMMRIQPKVEALKKRYAHLKATDPKKAEMNTEMMKLYKDEGVNMYGSCLPMLIQMPLLYAIYRVLANAVELRQAHWYWLTDLSSPDPLHILPILVILSMFVVQMMTPAAGMDPAQRRMMAFMMPALFGYTMWYFMSGLALYWGTGNLITLVIQFGINQSKMGKEMHALAAKRAQKKTGISPKTIQGKR